MFAAAVLASPHHKRIVISSPDRRMLPLAVRPGLRFAYTRLQASSRGPLTRMAVRTVLVCETQVPFVRGGAELLVRQLVDELRLRGSTPTACRFPSSGIRRRRSCPTPRPGGLIDLSESNGRPIDLVIATKFPTYLARHPHKVCWLVHQHRAAYELAATPYLRLRHDEVDVALRDG